MRLIFTFTLFIITGLFVANAKNTWVQKASKPSGSILLPASFSVGGKAYIGVGANSLSNYTNEFWEYDPATDSWTQKANFSGGRTGTVSFAIGNKGYVGLGQSGTGPAYSDMQEYDPANNTWTPKTSFSGGVRMFATAFAIGTKGYVGTGTGPNSSTQHNDFWEFDPVANTWTQKANVGSTLRKNATGFAVNGKGYITLGQDNNDINLNDIWEYDPSNNSWTQKSNFTGGARRFAVGFGLSTKGYITSGTNGTTIYNDLWQYDPSANQWVQKANFPGTARYGAVAVAVAGKGYFGVGFDNTNLYSDWWEYTPDNPFAAPVSNFSGSDTTVCQNNMINFTSQASNSPTSHKWYFPGGTPATSNAVNPSVTYNTAGTYDVILVVENSVGSDSLVKPNYIKINPLPLADAGSDTAVCMAHSVQLNANGGVSYSWSPSIGLSSTTVANPVATPNLTTKYIVTVTNTFGCSAKDTVEIVIKPVPPVSTSNDDAICEGASVLLNATGAVSYSWAPASSLDDATSATPLASPVVTTTYTVTGTGANGCAASDSIKITVDPAPATPVITQNGNILNATAGATSYIWYKNGVAIPGSSGDTLTITESATYTVEFVDANGCKSESQPLFATVVGIDEITSFKNISISPNPSSGLFEINWGEGVNLEFIYVYTATGKLVYDQQVGLSGKNMERVDLDSWPAGIYFIQFTGADNTSELRQIILQK